MLRRLYKIKKQHKKEKVIYYQILQLFPQLKYPSLKTCFDYDVALRYKFHLSYMLGEVLIEMEKTWYKGGVFKFFNNIEEARKIFYSFQQISKEIDSLHLTYFIRHYANNKEFFLQEFPKIDNLLKYHRDYDAILVNIFRNFSYFIHNFNFIEKWLLSDDFKQMYKTKNHPYPPLLDIKKLNNENEKINYHNISAELAWKMNLPLPKKYNFIFITGGSCGHMAMFLYFKLLKIHRSWMSNEAFSKYQIAYNLFNNSKGYNIFSYQAKEDAQKLFYLVDSEVPLVVLVRDPIERIKSLTNHIVKHIQKFNLTFHPEKVLENYYYKMQRKPSIEKVDDIISNPDYFNIFSKISSFKNITEIIVLDTKDISGDKCFDTFCSLAKKLNFNYPPLSFKKYFITPFVSKVMDMLPLVFVAHPMDEINFNNIENTDTTSFKLKDRIEIIITFEKMMLYCEQENLIDIKNDLLDCGIFSVPEEILFLVDKESYNRLKNDDLLLIKLTKYFKYFMQIFEEKVKSEKFKLFKEEDILSYLRKHRESRFKLKDALYQELIQIKEYCPDIVASWKYYQEFEKMCEELDGRD